jgi:uncharacterized heparinase superfamily protein
VSFKVIDLVSCPDTRLNTCLVSAPIEYPRCIIDTCNFHFLNQNVKSDLATVWNCDELPKLWLYNLHYFNDLKSGGSEKRQDLLNDLLVSWIEQNPPGHGVGWEPYPLSIRIVNLVKWQLSKPSFDTNIVVSLAVQVRYLEANIEYHLKGNHLFSNAKALVFAGYFFDGPEAIRWLQKGMRILISEVGEQILGDGGHYERSPMYHALSLEDMLDLENLMLTKPELFSNYQVHKERWPKIIDKMISWLISMSHPDGNISFFNDASFGIAPSNVEIVSYAKRLGHIIVKNTNDVVYLKDTGYIRVVKGPITLLIDVAAVGPDYIPAHAHADSLSYEFSFKEQRVVVNSGTSLYEQGTARDFQRGTSAHSTVEIDFENSSEVWHSFRVARRAQVYDVVIERSGSCIIISAKHNGYLRFKKQTIHKRTWIIDVNSLEIKDDILGGFSTALSRHYLHPEIKVSKLEGQNKFSLGEFSDVSLEIDSDDVSLSPSQWHPEFGVSVPNLCLHENLEFNSLKNCCRLKFISN